MLQLNGDNITTLGQAYLELNWKGLIGRVYRQTLDIPYLNKNDSRMIPNTFEAYGLGREGSSLDFLVGYVDKIKLRNSEDFISMGEAAGVEGDDTGTRVFGLLWKPPETGFDWGATIQRTPDILAADLHRGKLEARRTRAWGCWPPRSIPTRKGSAGIFWANSKPTPGA